MKIAVAAVVTASLAVSWAAPALAFCGFYVAKADAQLFSREFGTHHSPNYVLDVWRG